MLRRDFLLLSGAIVAAGTLSGSLTGCAGQPNAGKVDASGMRFSPQERQIIEQFYATARSRGPQSTAPAPRVRAGEKLVSGERPSKLPTDLDKLLPVLKAPYGRLVVGAEVVLVNHDTHDILDVVTGVAY